MFIGNLYLLVNYLFMSFAYFSSRVMFLLFNYAFYFMSLTPSVNCFLCSHSHQKPDSPPCITWSPTSLFQFPPTHPLHSLPLSLLFAPGDFSGYFFHIYPSLQESIYFFYCHTQLSFQAIRDRCVFPRVVG